MAGTDRVDRRLFLKSATAGAVVLGLSGRLLADEDAGKVMRRRPLGKTGIDVSVIGFGCGSITPAGLPILQAAHENGINLYDTAWGYGRGKSEEALGAFVQTLEDRGSIHIVTKASGFRPPDGSSKKVYEAFKAKLSESLARMKTDYVDVFYWPHGATNLKGTQIPACRDALEKLKKEGLIRHIGTSSHSNYAKVCEDAIEDGFYEVLMPVMNICTQNPDKAGAPPEGRRRRPGRSLQDTSRILPAAKRKKVGIVGMKVANTGFLGSNTDLLLSGEFPADSTLSRHQKLYSWMLRDEGLASVIVGIRSVKHLQEAIAIGVS